MQFVIVNDRGDLYRGFDSEEAKPKWVRGMRPDCRMDESLADAVVSQLTQLGFSKFVKRPADGVVRKWVPADLNATAAYTPDPEAAPKKRAKAVAGAQEDDEDLLA